MSYKNNFISVVIPAAGMGKRMKKDINKQFILLDNKPILVHTIKKFQDVKVIDEIVLVTRKEEMEFCKSEIIEKYGLDSNIKIVNGGKERQDSVYNGIKALSDECDIILVHDGARPFVSEKNIIDGIKGAIEYEACTIGVPIKDTIKVVDDEKNIINTPKRSGLWAVQTPQCFSYKLLLDAYEKGMKNDVVVTDDSMLVEAIGKRVKMIMGSYNNIKITTPEDLKIAMAILKDN